MTKDVLLRAGKDKSVPIVVSAPGPRPTREVHPARSTRVPSRAACLRRRAPAASAHAVGWMAARRRLHRAAVVWLGGLPGGLKHPSRPAVSVYGQGTRRWLLAGELDVVFTYLHSCIGGATPARSNLYFCRFCRFFVGFVGSLQCPPRRRTPTFHIAPLPEGNSSRGGREINRRRRLGAGATSRCVWYAHHTTPSALVGSRA